MARNVAYQFAEVLVAAGVKRIYGIVGDSLKGLTDSLRRQGLVKAVMGSRGEDLIDLARTNLWQ